MAVSQATKDIMKSRMPDLLAHYGVTNLTRNFRAFWREDDDPSATYYPDSNTVYDHGSGETFDVFSLVGRVEDVDGFRAQVDRVAEILGEHVEEAALPHRAKRKGEQAPFNPPERKGFDEDIRDACVTAHRALIEGGDMTGAWYARQWLHSRGFVNRETWLQFGFGYVANRRTKSIHSSFRVYEDDVADFVTIPHFDAKGEVHYCVLRTVIPEWANVAPNRKEWAPKNVTKPLYNEHYLNIGLDTVAVCEGPIDAISLAVMTGTPTIGLNGTSMATRLCALLYYTKPELRPRRIVLNLDAEKDGKPDKAGREAADKISKFLDKIGLDHSELKMPPGVRDANEWLQLQEGVA